MNTGNDYSRGDDILAELEERAREISAHPEGHAAAAVSMARATLDLIERLRRRTAAEAFETA